VRTTTHDDIMARLKSEGDCVVYVGTRNKDGYGQFTTQGQFWRANRYFYSYFVGPIPKGKLIRHTCDNPPCVLPSHLILGTDADNNRDMMERGRYNGGRLPEPTCKKGHERTEENTYVNKKTGQRQCRVCRKNNRKRA
jgi:hypothetical protein